MNDRALGLRPLTARSVVLSTLLGSHPPRLPVQSLIRVGGLFGIAEGTVRVALSRMTADGDLLPVDGTYELTARLLARQHDQDETRSPATRTWRGRWDVVIIDRTVRPGAGKTALLGALGTLRLAQLRDGVWLRPDNLVRPWPPSLPAPVTHLRAMPLDDAVGMARRLWPLEKWTTYASALLAAMADAGDPARRFALSAAVLRHLRTDPLLPPALEPPEWPGRHLRREYSRFEADLGRLLRSPMDDHPGLD